MTDIGHAVKHLRNLNTSVESISTEMVYLRELVESLSSEMCALRLSICDLIKENKMLKDEIKSLQAAQATHVPQPKQEKPPAPDLLIGNSIIRNVQPINPTELEVNSISGVKFEAVKDVLDNLSLEHYTYSYWIYRLPTK